MITSLSVHGFKSLRAVDNLELRPVNVLIGANSSGKSNLLDFFRMLSYIHAPGGGLQRFTRWRGGANALLHDGAATTTEMTGELHFHEGARNFGYRFTLAHSTRDSLFFAEESYRQSAEGRWIPLGVGQEESRLFEQALSHKPAKALLGILQQCRLHQFHNTSVAARMRQFQPLADGDYLKEDGANLAPALYRMREREPAYFALLERTLSLAFPQFAGFVLEPDGDEILLRWRERDSDLVFFAGQLSDGALRLVGLLFLLLQPIERRAKTLILDEPELGLHPAAIHLLAEHILAATREGTQVLLATQSSLLLNDFEADDVIVVNRPGRASELHRLESDKLTDWRDDYDLSTLWEKNVLGGRPR